LLDLPVLRPCDANAATRKAATAGPFSTWLTDLTVLLAIIGCGLLTHLYRGLFQDATIYTIEGLAHAYPTRYAQDVMLRFGSQDQFSLFARLYGALIRQLGVETAASLLTACGLVLFLLAAWQLARRLLPARLVPLAVGMLAVMPGVYGASALLHLIEDFVTPRIFSEALVLSALASWLSARRLRAFLLIAAALLVHPLMAMAGVVMLFWLFFGLEHRHLALALVGLGAGTLLVAGALAPTLRLDPTWFAFVSRNSYLFTEHWTVGDWGANLGPLVVIVAAIPRSTLLLRRFLIAVLLTALSGIALDWLGADRLHLVLIVQGQPWRWLWLSTCISLLILPWLAFELWNQGALGRATSLLLGADYLFGGETYTLPVLGAILGVLGLWWLRPHMDERRLRLVLLGAALLFLIALINGASTFLLSARYQFFPAEPAALPVWAKELRQGTSRFLIVPGLMVLLIVGARRAQARMTRWVLMALAVAGCAAVLPVAWTRWTAEEYGASGRAQFAAWRARIPSGAEVLCPDDPLLVYLLLERRSYLSIHQEGSGLFSRAAAVEILRREATLRGFPDAIRDRIALPDHADAASGSLTDVCSKAGSDVAFIVTSSDLKAAPIALVPRTARSRFSKWRLYSCPLTSGAASLARAGPSR
jgi:hypothetical protein